LDLQFSEEQYIGRAELRELSAQYLSLARRLFTEADLTQPAIYY